MMRFLARCASSAVLAASLASAQSKFVPMKTDSDALFKAMKEELKRSRALRVVNLDEPYFIEYSVDDSEGYSVSASLGGVLDSRETHMRLPRVHVRVGSYQFDNTNYIYSDYFSGNNVSEQLPLEDKYSVLRTIFWLATDRGYKGSVEAIGRKRAALRDVTAADQTPDFAKVPLLQLVKPNPLFPIEPAHLVASARSLSAQFVAFPEVVNSSVEVTVGHDTFYMMNSEGTQLALPENLSYVRIKASGRAPDGMPVRDAITVQAPLPGQLPQEAELRRLTEVVANNVTNLVKAPAGENYSGPVLFAGEAAPQIISQLLGANLSLNRKPVGEPGRPIPIASSELETRLGSRILPEWMDVVDDPAITSFQGKPLLGSMIADEEGVAAKPVTVVQAGKLKSFLLTRQPVKTYTESNGRARVPGAFGARAAMISNLIVKAGESKSDADLKKQLIALCKERGLAFGILIRKLDYPSSASIEEFRQIAASIAQNGGSGHPVSIPLLTYKVYPDGREELVRGLRFRGLNAKSLKDILAASSEQFQFDFQNNTAPFALTGGTNFYAPCSVVSPSLLFDDVDLEKQQDELTKPPLVPPPSLASR